jgi:hypothetical protein
MNMAKQIYYHRRRKELIRQQCNDMLRAMVGENIIPKWWDSPNQAFDMQTPKIVFDKDPNKVYTYLAQHCLGR